MGITHEWNGTILTITSDSGTSSCDLKGDKGDDGCRGPQGIAGVSDLTGYATEDYVNRAIEAIEVPEAEEVDLSNYYTKTEVEAKIAEAQLGGEEVDLSAYALKTEIPDISGLATKEEVAAKQNAVFYSSTEPTGWANGDIWLQPAE